MTPDYATSLETLLLDVPFDFVSQPDPVPAALRPERRVPLTLLLVAKSHGGRASWTGLQLLNWALRHGAHAELLFALRERRDIPDRPVVRFDAALDRALDLAVGLGLLLQESARVFKLTEAGRRLVDELVGSDAFTPERQLLDRIQGKVTQKEVARLLEWRDT